MQNLDRTGTYLKYFGRKQDTVYIKNLLISIKLRWKKLVRRADEKGRLLQQAYKEDKRVCCFSFLIFEVTIAALIWDQCPPILSYNWNRVLGCEWRQA